MKKNLLPIYLFGLLAASVITGCQKEGCTDDIATNFDSKAKKDDGSCVYDASVQFWFDEETALGFAADDIAEIIVYIDDVEIGSYLTDDFEFNAPACAKAGIIYKTFNLGKAETKKITYYIDDHDGYEIDSGTIELDAVDKCTSFQIEY
jgi:hypothetical protein